MTRSIARFSIGAALITAMFGCAKDGPPTVGEFHEQLERTRVEVARLGALVVERRDGPQIPTGDTLEIVCACPSIPKPNDPFPTPPPLDPLAVKLGLATLQRLQDASVARQPVAIVGNGGGN